MLKYKTIFFFEIKNVMLKITISTHGAKKLLVIKKTLLLTSPIFDSIINQGKI